ncbi:MAG: zinc-dependent alcohol dehydrogenase family protein [Candidatus Methanomethylicia archaeon]|nr:zinc-dependent alcohol dehydrogenase family protein [Candidatus Methanomethylicia archaeon]
MVLEEQKPIEENPLKLIDLKEVIPGEGEVVLKVKSCGVCRTDLHIIEGEIKAIKLPLILGHQVIGEVIDMGNGVRGDFIGRIFGVPWLYWSCGKCKYCVNGSENLCLNALFTGYSVDGGYAEYMKAKVDYIHEIPKGLDELHSAPLLCGGAIGYRAFKMTKTKIGDKLGLFGFGSSAHMILQVAKHMGIDVYVFTRSKRSQDLALRLGATWAGDPRDELNVLLDAAIVFAPAGWVVIEALKKINRGGRLILAGIYMSPIERINYQDIWLEKEIKSVANVTRNDVREFLDLASKIYIKTEVTVYPLEKVNEALKNLKYGEHSGSIVLKIH